MIRQTFFAALPVGAAAAILLFTGCRSTGEGAAAPPPPEKTAVEQPESPKPAEPAEPPAPAPVPVKAEPAATPVPAAKYGPRQAGVAFRFDDNQTAQKWRDMGDIFDDYGFPMSMGINLARVNPTDQEYLKVLRRLQKNGHELMDHTPDHTIFRMRVDYDTAVRLKENPGVDHFDGKAAYFKYRVRTEELGDLFLAGVDGNRITVPEEIKAKFARDYIIYSARLGAAFMLAKSGDGYLLHSFWDENNVKLEKEEKHEFRFAPRGRAFAVHPDALRFMASYVRERAKEFGLEAPVSWIHPGSREPLIRAEEVREIYGKEFGYVGAATYGSPAAKVFCEPDPDRCRFAMQWGNFDLESQTAAQAKKLIADGVARHQVLIGRGHMWTHKVDGGPEEYAKRHRELLAWCKEVGIPVRTQSEWARILYLEPADPTFDIMPKIDVDRDGDGVPDGFTPGVDAKVDGDAFAMAAAGRIFFIERLGGLARGLNTFRFTADGDAGSRLKAVFELLGPGGKRSRVELDFAFAAAGEQEFSGTVEIPEETVRMNVELNRLPPVDGGAVRVKKLSFRPEPATE